MKKTGNNCWNPFKWITAYFQTEKTDTKSVAAKQKIAPHSPAKKEQDKFIDEGGNSQPLK